MRPHVWILAIFLLLPLESLAQEGGPRPTEVADAPSTSSEKVVGILENRLAEVSLEVVVPEEIILVSLPTSNPLVSYSFTNHGATLRSAKMLDEKFTREELPILDWVPDRAVEGGQIDLVSTWHPTFLPYRLSFEAVKLGIKQENGTRKYDENHTRVKRVVRWSDRGRLKKGVTIEDVSAEHWKVNRMVRPGDNLQVFGVEALKDKLFSIKSVSSGGGKLEVTPKIEGVEGKLEYKVFRDGVFNEVFKSDPVFTRVTPDVGLPLTYVWPDPVQDTSPIYIEKRFYATDKLYQLRLEIEIHNFSDHTAEYTSHVVISAWQHPSQGESRGFVRPTDIYAASCFTGQSLEREEFPGLSEEPNGVECPFDTEWVGVDTVYFLNAIAPNKSNNRRGHLRAWGATGAIQARLKHPTTNLAAGTGACTPDWLELKGHLKCSQAYELLGYDPSSKAELQYVLRKAKDLNGLDEAMLQKLQDAYESIRSHRKSREPTSYVIYTGPKDPEILLTAGHNLQAAMDYGYLSIIAKPLHGLLRWFHGLLGDWGLAIILLTILVKLCLLPLTQKSFMAMQKMQQLKPELDKLKKQHEGDKQAFNKAMFALYKRHKVNPLGGCLPMLLQMPIWIALYQTIANAVELFHTPLGLWIEDLSSSDPYYIMPVCMGALMIVQNAISGSTATMEGIQAKMMKWGMPIMFTVFMLFLPSGLVLYILVNTILTIFQNLYIRRGLQK